jgi:hypothetical protein
MIEADCVHSTPPIDTSANTRPVLIEIADRSRSDSPSPIEGLDLALSNVWSGSA